MIVPIASGVAGRVGKFSCGMVGSAASTVPQVMVTSVPESASSTGSPGSVEATFASTTPGSRTRPGSSTWAGI